MAQVRAQTIATRIRPNVRQPGQPRFSRAATTMAARAKGRAKIVCEKRTKESHLLIEENIQPSTFNTQHRIVSRLRWQDNGRNSMTFVAPQERYVSRSGCSNGKCELTHPT